jgi:superfamily II DNA or RNA helicase
MAVNFSSKILSKCKSDLEYRMYRAALEWDLADPIVIESADDFKSSKWKGKLTPYHHQVTNLITFCRRLPVTLLADDVGLGKTISAGLIISELIARNRLNKILIVCPKLLGAQWKSELKEKFDLEAEVAIGRDLLDADPDDTGAVITTYNTARLYLDKLPPDRFQMLVLDEAHKLRNLYGTDNPPQVAKCFRKALEDRRFRFVLMLTATPIQNRLWDLYSLVDLLTVARGHENPFGSEGMFVRKFVADNRDDARILKQEAKDEFRSIVYGYMSRVRRGDANLLFPERAVQMHKVNPTEAELRLIKVLAKPLQEMNKLTQISILQALTSSPEALQAQLENMARKGTAPRELFEAVRDIVKTMPRSAKLNGLAALIEGLKQKNPDSWRLVVFTGRRETQTTIQNFLETYGLKVGIINGDSGERNQETIARFKKSPPDLRVIVSTEAGSEGVNLQVANVLVNYDLPWNPMIVEQRIGRVQRLASDHAYVTIFNVMLKGTFEEYIVGRLMEKLQMASHAVGDIEALLQGSDIGAGDDDPDEKFEAKILELVLKALAGKDFEKGTQLAEQSIEAAKIELEREERAINEMLGGMDGAGYVGPKSPSLPALERMMEPKEFVLAAYKFLGAKISEEPDGLYRIEEGTGREFIRFDDNFRLDRRSLLCIPGAPAFQRLVSRLITSGLHGIEDPTPDVREYLETSISNWVKSFNGKLLEHRQTSASRQLDANVIARVRATVAHDSYERLVEVECVPLVHRTSFSKDNLQKIAPVVEDPTLLGLQSEIIVNQAQQDEGIAEFTRFYLERREHEVRSAGNDERKRKKLHDEFSPSLDVSLVGILGKVFREVKAIVKYSLAEAQYESTVILNTQTGLLSTLDEIVKCELTGVSAPSSCFDKCAITGKKILKHHLVQSESSGRRALPEYGATCAISKRKVLQDELETSCLTGARALKNLLISSSMSGKYAEKEHFKVCSFTGASLLPDEVKVSEVSGRLYRSDQTASSVISGKSGHWTEFARCQETNDFVANEELEKCDETGKSVKKGILVLCEESNKNVLPSLTERCAVSGKRALKTLLVKSSISGVRFLSSLGVTSTVGTICSPWETKECAWSGERFHPDDLRLCTYTGINVHLKYMDIKGNRLASLHNVLSGVVHAREREADWPKIEKELGKQLKGGECKILAAMLSPNFKIIAAVAEVKTFFGFRQRHVGFLFSVNANEFVGRLVSGKQTKQGWKDAA